MRPHFDIKQTTANRREENEVHTSHVKQIYVQTISMFTLSGSLSRHSYMVCVNKKTYCNHNANFDKNLGAITNISTFIKHTTRYLFSSEKKTVRAQRSLCPHKNRLNARIHMCVWIRTQIIKSNRFNKSVVVVVVVIGRSVCIWHRNERRRRRHKWQNTEKSLKWKM